MPCSLIKKNLSGNFPHEIDSVIYTTQALFKKGKTSLKSKNQPLYKEKNLNQTHQVVSALDWHKNTEHRFLQKEVYLTIFKAILVWKNSSI